VLVAGCCLALLVTGCGSGGASGSAATSTGAGSGAAASSGPTSSGNTSGGTAIAVPGLAKLEAPDLAGSDLLNGQVDFIACWSAGNCTAAGTYGSTDGATGATAVFVVSEKNGTWSSATTVPGATTADALSCPSAGNCLLGGVKTTQGSATSTAYVVAETGGTWGAPQVVPTRTGPGYTVVPADVYAISCTAPGDCTVVGQALNATPDDIAHGGGSYAPIVANLTNGALGSVTELPLPSFQSPGDSNADQGWLSSLSCASAGNCTATGIDEQQANDPQDPAPGSIFAASEVSGHWSAPALLPGSAARSASNTETGQVSCASAGNCGYVGYYADGSGNTHPFVASQVGGTWDSATDVKGDPGYAMKSDSEPAAISCPAPGDCTAVLDLEDTSQNVHAFAVSEASGTWGTATEVKDPAGEVGLNVVSCASAGNCVAAGSDGNGPITVDSVNGAWQPPAATSGTSGLEKTEGAAAANAGGSGASVGAATVTAISCVAGGYCGIGGEFPVPNNGGTEAFLVEGG